MSTNPSASKRVKTALRNRSRNKIYKSNIKSLIKKYLVSLHNIDLKASDTENVKHNLSAVYSKIDKAVNKGILHKNHGARKKAALAKSFKNKLAII